MSLASGAVAYPNYPLTFSSPVDSGGSVVAQYGPGSLAGSFTTASMSNSTSLTLSVAFTALVFTQTSTGNTVNLPAAPVNGQLCGFSITNNVTNLTVSAATNTVKNGASTNTSTAGSNYWWLYNQLDATWYRYGGDPLGT